MGSMMEKALNIMSAALGPDDPKTQTVARNLSATQVLREVHGSILPCLLHPSHHPLAPHPSHPAVQVIEVNVVESPRAMPAALSQRLSQKAKAKTEEEVKHKEEAAAGKRDAVLQVIACFIS